MDAAQTISNLERIVTEKSSEFRELFGRLYLIDLSTSKPQLTSSMAAGAQAKYKCSAGELASQEIVTVRNRWTQQMAIFNAQRLKRPMQSYEACLESENEQTCDFCTPEANTPTDALMGRLERDHAITGSNLFPFAAEHTVLISKHHSPLDLSRELLGDQLYLAREWGERHYAADSTLAVEFPFGNIGRRAASSVEHNHMQAIMVRGGHLPGPERFKMADDNYSQWGTNGKSLFEDIFTIHEGLGLGVEHKGSRVMVELTPIKDRGIMAFKPIRRWGDFVELADAAYAAISAYRRMGITDFNFGFLLPSIPMDYGWDRLPAIFRIFERGNPKQKTADLGSVETIGEATVVGTDPFKVMPYLMNALAAQKQ